MLRPEPYTIIAYMASRAAPYANKCKFPAGYAEIIILYMEYMDFSADCL